MKRLICSYSTLLFMIGACMPALRAQGPVLEAYSITHGGNQAPVKSSEFEAVVSDRFLGNGTARAQIKIQSRDAASSLSLLVVRSVQSGETVFALLVSRVEVRAYDSGGGQIYARDLNGVVFGDSQSGVWLTELEDLPLNAQQTKITFFGNYE